jgi:hypothetical protein
MAVEKGSLCISSTGDDWQYSSSLCLVDSMPNNKLLVRLPGSHMDLENLAKRIRETCIQAARRAYEDAGILGLCEEGRWEAAVDALKTVDLAPLLREFKRPPAE